jgi:hypothetical protein
MGVRPYDPLVKPTFMSEMAKGNPSEYRKMLTSPSEQDKVWPALKEIRDIDRQFAYACDFMICSLPKLFTVGTFEELTIAVSCNKPVLLHSPDGLISTWLPPMLANTSQDYWANNHFNEWGPLYEHLRGINEGTAKVDNLKWIFLTYFNDPDVKPKTELVNAAHDAK